MLESQTFRCFVECGEYGKKCVKCMAYTLIKINNPFTHSLLKKTQISCEKNKNKLFLDFRDVKCNNRENHHLHLHVF